MGTKKENYLTADKIIKLWQLGKEPDWRQQPPQGRIQWLKACVQWTGLPKTRIHQDNYIIDGLQISDKTGFYCLLGEVFFGYKGYFGQDLYGFNDCFSEIGLYEKEKTLVETGSIVTILHSVVLAEVLNIDNSEYFQNFLADLKKRGFKVVLQ